jgi:2-dehydro-3-deoxy-D-arabinonate dehydratase
VRVRADSKWSVPEPELALVISPAGKIVGYTIGNDMSARDIEGENPLYLPQAKIYKQSCSVGPLITPVGEMPPLAGVEIKLNIRREGTLVFEGTTTLAQMARTTEGLAEWLFKENEFPHGAVLLTGTGIVPPDEFTLKPGDDVAITIAGIGTLRNPVV